MLRSTVLLIAVLCGVAAVSQKPLAQTLAPTASSDSIAKKQKRNEEIAREKRKAAKQWTIDSQKALATWAKARQTRRDCQKLASERKLYFAKRLQFVRECVSRSTA